MHYIVRKASVVLLLVAACVADVADQSLANESLADENRATEKNIRVVSWNISDDAFVREPDIFRSFLLWADPDVVLLDEVLPSVSQEALVASLVALRPNENDKWTVNTGTSGGRQRCIVASRAPQEALPEFSAVVPYPDADRDYIFEHMSKRDRTYSDYSMEGGIPVNGAIILVGERRLLTVIADLQCCGDDQNSWQEFRRRVEAREIARLVRQVLQRTTVDGIVIAGDLNLVNGTMPMIILNGPYAPTNEVVIGAELHHPDGYTSWTWDGRRTPFPSGTLDYQLFGPQGLTVRSSVILDTEKLPSAVLQQLELANDAASRTGRHRPLMVEYEWN